MSAAHTINDDAWLAVVGTGPGTSDWLTPETSALAARATDLVGYGPYVARLAGATQRVHASDNRYELQRAAHALDLAADGARVAVVSGGDPGIYGMAAAVWEALERADHTRWAGVAIHIAPGVSAIQAVAAAAGAPLGNDFCVMSLSNNLKPWSLIEQRLHAVGAGDFAVSFYNPISRARPWQLGAALDILRGYRPEPTPVIVGSARKKENSAAARLSARNISAPPIVAPERETPGTSASIWQQPIASASHSGNRVASW